MLPRASSFDSDDFIQRQKLRFILILAFVRLVLPTLLISESELWVGQAAGWWLLGSSALAAICYFILIRSRGNSLGGIFIGILGLADIVSLFFLLSEPSEDIQRAVWIMFPLCLIVSGAGVYFRDIHSSDSVTSFEKAQERAEDNLQAIGCLGLLFTLGGFIGMLLALLLWSNEKLPYGKILLGSFFIEISGILLIALFMRKKSQPHSSQDPPPAI